MDFTRVVKQRMAEQQMTSAALAHKTGYSQQYISDLLAGRRRWNETTMSRVAQVLGITISFAPAKDSDSATA